MSETVSRAFRLRIVEVERDNDDRWIIEVKVIPFIFVASQR